MDLCFIGLLRSFETIVSQSLSQVTFLGQVEFNLLHRSKSYGSNLVEIGLIQYWTIGQRIIRNFNHLI